MLTIFNTKVNLRPYVCSPNGGIACQRSKVNLYIYASGTCPSKCSFCPGFNSTKPIDFEKLKKTLQELREKDVINRIGITGGEPMINPGQLDTILGIIKEVCGFKYHVSINTSGINLNRILNLDNAVLIKDVHLSRHAVNDDSNNKIFGIKTPSIINIKDQVKKKPGLLSLSCNLIRGEVDCPKSLKEYLDFAIDVGAAHVGFVSLMQLPFPSGP
jgi:MoaA/NifB/PqqE/SkfB family radical SAM enzyme